MKLNLPRRAVASVVCSAAAVGAAMAVWPAGTRAGAPADAAPGLVGKYYNDLHGFKALEGVRRDPFYVRVDPNVDFAVVDGDFYGTHLTTDFAVAWTGSIHVDKPGKYRFGIKADDAGKLFVNDKVVIDSVRNDKNPEKHGEIDLPAAGDYAIKVEFCQYGGGAGCLLTWQPPDEKEPAPVPASALSHAKSAEDVKWDKADWDLYTADHEAWIKKHGKPYEKMDYGSFLSGTFGLPEPSREVRGKDGKPAKEPNVTDKGIIVTLDKKTRTNVLFDTEMCRYSGGWTGGFINFAGVAYDGAHGTMPRSKGTQVFGTPEMPGWEHEGSWKDPRKVPYGSLPANWCHYRGLYRHGDDVVFSYTVNGVGVLDKPGVTQADGKTTNFSRSLLVDPSTKPLRLVVSSGNVTTSVADAEMGVGPNGCTVVTIPPHSEPKQYVITFGGGPALGGKLSDVVDPVDWNTLTHGGPARWGAPIETQGKLGTGDGPYVVDTITPPEKTPSDAWLRFSGFDFFPDGKSAAICTWNGDVWVVKGIDGDLSHLTWQRYATGLFQTLGLKIVNGEVYVLGRDQITRLHDLNGDGEADWYENFNNDCQVTPGFHEFQHDLQVDSKGYFYYAKGGPVNPGGRGFEALSEDNGCVMQVSPDGKTSKVYATGLRAPNGMSMGPHDEITVSDNQGTWTPACRISFVTPGAFLGVPSTSHRTPEPKNYGDPICWFPYVDGDYTQGDNSSGGAAWDTSDKWGPFDGQLLHLSYGTCSVFETMYEKTDGLWQGGVVRFPLDFDSGVMRARFNAVDGQLYVCGLKGWQTRATKDGIFQRVRYTQKTVYMPDAMHVQRDGIRVQFKQPVDKSIAGDADNYSVEQWNYVWADTYGSPEMSVKNPKKKGHDAVDIDSVVVSPDGRSVVLKMPSIRPVMQMKITMKIKAADGTPMNWEIDNTINAVPGQKPIGTPQPQ